MRQKSNEYRLLTELYFRLLPYQVLLLAINAVNGIVDALYASNVIGTSAMSAIGIFGPINQPGRFLASRLSISCVSKRSCASPCAHGGARRPRRS